MSEPTPTEQIMFLVERYGYARREGRHQGKASAAWFQEVERRVDLLVVALREQSAESHSKHRGSGNKGSWLDCDYGACKRAAASLIAAGEEP